MTDFEKLVRRIGADWVKMPASARAYYEPLLSMQHATDPYYMDSGKSIILYFLANAGTWRGDEAKAVKAELKALVA